MLPFEIYKPSAALKPFIQCYLFVHAEKNLLLRAYSNKLQVLPTPFSSMVLFFSEPSYKKVAGQKVKLDDFSITGFNTSPKIYERASDLKQMIVCFSSIGIQAFLDFSLKEITDGHAPVKLAFREHHDMLINKLSHTNSNLQRIHTVETFLLTQLSKQKTPDSRISPLLKYIYAQQGATSVKKMAEELAIGERTLQRLVHQYVGINLKFFSRLIRFQAARTLLLQKNAQQKLTEIAYRLNYYDQAHFIHDFCELSGQTPGAYLKSKRTERHAALDFNTHLDESLFNSAKILHPF